MPARKLNKRFALISTVAIVVLCTCTYFVHGYQVRQNASSMMARAKSAEQEGDYALSAEYYRRYLGFIPSDAEALGRYGLLLSNPKFAKSKRDSYAALQILEKALRADPKRHDLRRSVVRLSVELSLFGNARDDLQNYLIPEFPDDAELHYLLAQSYEGLGAYRDARESYRKSIRIAPESIDSYTRLARMMRRHSKDIIRDKETVADIVTKADETMNAMVDANRSSYRVYLLRAEYRLEFEFDEPSTLAAVGKDIEKALALAPDAADVVVAGAQLFSQQRRPDEARKLLDRGCQLHPTDWRIYLAQARLESAQNKPDAALARLQEGLRKVPRQIDLLWHQADLLTSLGRTEEVNETIRNLESVGVRPSDLEIFRARLLMKDEHWWEAARILERIAPLYSGRDTPGANNVIRQQTLQAGVLLGTCCEQLGDYHRAKSAFSRVIAQDAQSIPARLGLAACLVALGEVNEAIDQYRQLALKPEPPVVAWIELTRLLLLRNLTRQPDQRDWTEIENAIRLARKIEPLPVQIVVFHSEMLVARQRLGEARDVLLEKYRESKSRPAEVWMGLATIEQHEKGDEAAISLLDDADHHVPNSPDLMLTRARILARRTDAKAGEAIARLADRASGMDASDRLRLWRGLTAIAMQKDDVALASRLLKQIVKERPRDLPSQLGLFDVALKANDANELQQVVRNIQLIEGDEGIMWRFAKASMHIATALRGDRSGLSEARTLLTAAAARRPDWSRLVLSQAQLDDLEGNRADAALAGYQRALQLGVRDTLAIRRVIEILFEQQRFSEAYDTIKRLSAQAALPTSLKRIGAELSLNSKDPAMAQQFADSAVAKDSTDYRDHLWLGRIYHATGRIEDASREFQRARSLGADEPLTLVGQVQFLAATGKKDQARAEIETVQSRRPQDARMGLALAMCFEAIGEHDRARAQYEATMSSAPADLSVIQVAADYYYRTGQFAAAEPLLRKLADSQDKSSAAVGWARRNLAVILAARGDLSKRNESLSLLASDTAATTRGQSILADQRARAMVLTMQGSSQARREAAKIIDGLIDRRVAIPNDYFLVAQLHESLGDWPRAHSRFLAFMEQPGSDSPAHLLIIARSLLRHGDVEDAKPLVKQFLASVANSNTFSAVELKARLLRAEGKATEAIALVQSFVRADETKLVAAAALLSEVEAFAQAEDLYRQQVKRSKKPGDALELARFLINRNQAAAALEICDQVWMEASPLEVAEVALTALGKSPANAVAFARIERRLNDTIAKQPGSAGLVAALAALRNFQGRYDDAEQLYRRALEIDSRLDVALNNLAWLLTLRGGRASEALELLRRAVEINGLDPGLLDTRGVAYIALKQGNSIELAIEDLKSSSADAPSAATFFHLAQAYATVGRKKEANQAWKNAMLLGLSPEQLHPLERPAFERLAKELSQS